MQYPLISEYVRAIQDANSNLDKLAHLEPVLDDHGEPYRSSGAFAVVFKMKDEQTGKCYALKCFTEEQEGRAEAYCQIADELEFVDSSYITSVKYLDKEIFVDSSCEEDEFPVLLMDWIDGETMENYIAENYQDNYGMAMLCYRFCKMAAWLRSQPFAHGDIKPDNIMVRPDGNLTLVDYDGMFVPAMKGQKSPTIGTKDFSHPLRTIDDFDETIDDFALASIALSLKVISLKPSLFDEYGAADRLLFSADDYCDLSKSKVMAALLEQMNNEELTTLLSMFLLANAKKNLALCSFRLFVGKKPENKIELLSTEVTNEELSTAVRDDFRCLYSRDGRKLINAGRCCGKYIIKSGTMIICNRAFEHTQFWSVFLPESLTMIGECAFNGVPLKSIVIPSNVVYIGKDAFNRCKSLSSIVISNSVVGIENGAFRYCCSLEEIILPNKIKFITKSVFSGCRSLRRIMIPDGVLSIDDFAFAECNSLANINIPASVTGLGNGVFRRCSSLESIAVPSGVRLMTGNPFAGWNGQLQFLSSNFVYEDGVLYNKNKTKIISFRKRVKKYVIPECVTCIGDGAFMYCNILSSVIISEGVICIGANAFCGCNSLSSIVIPESVVKIGAGAFRRCWALQSIDILGEIDRIDNGTFSGCSSLKNVVIPNSVKYIGINAFWGCNSLSKVVIPENVTSIGDFAFSNCGSLSGINIPDSVTSVGGCAFMSCWSLPSSKEEEIISRFGERAMKETFD